MKNLDIILTNLYKEISDELKLYEGNYYKIINDKNATKNSKIIAEAKYNDVKNSYMNFVEDPIFLDYVAKGLIII